MSRLELDLNQRQVHIVRLSLLGRSERELAFGDLESVHMQEGADSDGDPTWRPVIHLRSSEDVLLSELWSHDRPGVENSLRVVAEACGVPVREVVGVGRV
jgi:hypothetical protein